MVISILCQQWDLDTGKIARRFVAHAAQLAALAVRPLGSDYPSIPLQFSQIKTDNGRPGKSHSATGDETLSHSGVPTGRRSYVAASRLTSSHDSIEARHVDADAHSEADSLFGDEPDAEGEPDDTPGVAPPLSIPSAGPAPAPLAASLAVPGPKPPMPAPAPKNAPPILDASSYAKFSHDIIMTAAMDGQVVLWDCRAASGAGYGVGRLWMGEKTPPWCLSVRHHFPCQMHLVSCDLNFNSQACWSPNGGQIYAGRRNGTVDVWDVRQLGRSGPAEVPRLLKTLRNPPSSGIVSCVVAFPDGCHIAW